MFAASVSRRVLDGEKNVNRYSLMVNCERASFGALPCGPINY